MAGTPTGSPQDDTPAGQQQDENGLGWQRPVPQRWSPSGEAQATGLTPDPAIVPQYVTPPSLTEPQNAAVMRTAPGELAPGCLGAGYRRAYHGVTQGGQFHSAEGDRRGEH